VSESLSVSQLAGYIRRVVSAQDGLRNVTVYGEVSGFKYSGAHAYFRIKDQDASIDCSLFNARRTYNPSKEGESVLVTGSVDFYAKSGKLSLIVSTMQPVGVGKLHLMLEALKAKLKEEGLFDPAHKKPIPQFAKRVCVVTSKTGAVIRDIVRTVRNKNKVLDIVVYDVRVQGDNAASEMCQALRFVDTLGFDCIILARGGGSFEDLMPFNDEALARVIYDMQTPIISAVGHETDFSISDFVADARAATPTAAGELIAYDQAEWKETILEQMTRSYRRIAERYSYIQSRYTALNGQLEAKSVRRLDRAEEGVKTLLRKMDTSLDNALREKQIAFEKLTEALSRANPVRLLQNGYTKLTKEGHNADYDTVNNGDTIHVVGYKGTLVCEVKDKIPNGKE
jgi:exodeoxyribonuclease VII large subunit